MRHSATSRSVAVGESRSPRCAKEISRSTRAPPSVSNNQNARRSSPRSARAWWNRMCQGLLPASSAHAASSARGQQPRSCVPHTPYSCKGPPAFSYPLDLRSRYRGQPPVIRIKAISSKCYQFAFARLAARRKFRAIWYPLSFSLPNLELLNASPKIWALALDTKTNLSFSCISARSIASFLLAAETQIECRQGNFTR
jgi:hypothetical protein